MDEKQLRDVIFRILKENKPHLRSEITEFMNQQYDSIFRFGFIGASREDFQLDKTIQIVNDSFDLEDNPRFSLENGVFFRLKNQDEVYPPNVEISKDSIQKQKIFVGEFLEDFKKKEVYKLYCNNVSRFECFNEKIQKNNERIPHSIYNIEGWSSFLKQIFETLYPDFESSEKQKVVRFSKSISSASSIIFEYSRKEFESSLKQGVLMLPDIRISWQGDTSSKQNTEFKIYLGEFENRFFRVISLDQYKALLSIEVTEEGFFKNSSDVLSEYVDNEFIHVFGDKLRGSMYRDYAFFELYLKSIYNRIYLNYIEKSLIEVNSRMT